MLYFSPNLICSFFYVGSIVNVDLQVALVKDQMNNMTLQISNQPSIQQPQGNLDKKKSSINDGNEESRDDPSNQNHVNGTNSNLANMKEKTPMCLVNELARFNKIQHQYRLTNEQGPAHKKRFTVTLKLGEEEYVAEGPSIKKAQHSAASEALTKTWYRQPPPKPPRAMRVPGKCPFTSGNVVILLIIEELNYFFVSCLPLFTYINVIYYRSFTTDCGTERPGNEKR